MMWTVLLLGVLGSVTGLEHAFTSVNSMQALVGKEGRVIETMKNIIKKQEARLEELVRFKSYYETAHQSAVANTEVYVMNPINSFQLIKRLTTDWATVEELITSPVIGNITEIKQSLDLPMPDDLDGAAEALCRLQDTYKLGTSELAKGFIRGIQYSQPMSASDTLAVGRRMYSLTDFYHAASWFEEALKLHENEKDDTIPFHATSKATILDYLAFTVYNLGDYHLALKLTNEYLALNPNCTRNKMNQVMYTDALRRGSVVKLREESKLVKDGLSVKFEKLCRGEVEVDHRLVCRYEDNNIPYLLLGKLKLEEVNLDPFIVIYHQVIYDSEIERIVELSRPLIGRSTVRNVVGNRTIKSINSARISQTATLWKYQDPAVTALDWRSAMLANLTDKASENLEVLNYGIGGHYAPHFDYLQTINRGVNYPGFIGNRIASILFYMSDVEQGGATVFPKLGRAVFPRKGSALLWYNLHRDGEGDSRTIHGGCPVLIGSKWASNKWFHEETQEFRRPCLLEQDSLPHTTSKGRM